MQERTRLWKRLSQPSTFKYSKNKETFSRIFT
jgi:hypothetical protein